MKKIFLTSIFISIFCSSIAQVDEYQQYLESLKKEQSEFVQDNKKDQSKISQEYSDFKAKANAEFAEFVAKEWALFEEFKTQELSMSKPKPKSVPQADKSAVTDIDSDVIDYKKAEKESKETVTEVVKSETKVSLAPRTDSYNVKKVVTDSGVKDYENTETKPAPKTKVIDNNNFSMDYYGLKLNFHVDDKLRLRHKGISEKDVSDYFTQMSKLNNETHSLWVQIDDYVNNLGLNEWGYFSILRSLSESMFSDIDNRVLFTFYMLRNEGGFKAKIARGKDSNKMTLLAAIDNSKDVYSYTFFRLNDAKDGSVSKYYSVYGGGNSKESIYTYDKCEQDAELKEIGLDFHKTLNMGPCNYTRELNFAKINSKITLPYNRSHLAYLNDVPMTVFPIYFASPISIEAQQIFNTKLEEIKSQYSPVQFIDIILNFVQTAFEYKTDEDQFGYEKYFYPEEVIGYPYSDCEDRSALFTWLVTNYTDAQVVGLQYEGHLATAVYFGENVNINGDAFIYGGKKYYVCDPTYINASIGMTMPQFKDVMPKIVK